jgi:hypothetical protein
MNNDNNDNLNFLEKTKESALGIYILLLFLIFIFPPMNKKVEFKITTEPTGNSPSWVPTGIFDDVFVGWKFILNWGSGGHSINITYLLIEIIILTLLYRGLLWVYLSGYKNKW